MIKFLSLDQISLEHITCTVEDCDHQEPPSSSPDALKPSEEQKMQELLQPRVQDSPVILSEGDIESPQTEQQDDDVSMSIKGEFVITQNIHTFLWLLDTDYIF